MPTHIQSAPRRQVCSPINLRPVSFRTEVINYVPFVTTYNGVRQPVNFVQTILTAQPTGHWDMQRLGFRLRQASSCHSEYLFGSDLSMYWKTWRCWTKGHVRHAMIDHRDRGAARRYGACRGRLVTAR
jgi:hypothetical protein